MIPIEILKQEIYADARFYRCWAKPLDGFNESVNQALAAKPPRWADALEMVAAGKERYTARQKANHAAWYAKPENKAGVKTRKAAWLAKPGNAARQKAFEAAYRAKPESKVKKKAAYAAWLAKPENAARVKANGAAYRAKPENAARKKEQTHSRKESGATKSAYERGKQIFARELGSKCVHCGEDHWSKLMVMHKFGTPKGTRAPSSFYSYSEAKIMTEIATGKYEMGCKKCNTDFDRGNQWPIVDGDRYSEASRKNFGEYAKNRVPSQAQIYISRNTEIVREEYGIWCPIFGTVEGPENRFVWSHLVNRKKGEPMISRFYQNKTDMQWKQEVADKNCIWCSQKANKDYDDHWHRDLGHPQTIESRLAYAQSVWAKIYQETGEGPSCPWPRP